MKEEVVQEVVEVLRGGLQLLAWGGCGDHDADDDDNDSDDDDNYLESDDDKYLESDDDHLD